jgi:acyl-CoA hydrolase
MQLDAENEPGTKMKKRPARSAQESMTEMVQIVLPNDTNTFGNVLGGHVMHWIDLVGAVTANRHCRMPIVTASMERLDFLSPIRLGDIVVLKARLNFVGTSSMEVGVDVYSENPLSGEHRQTSSAVLTYVALDLQGNPAPVPGLIVKTEEERRRFQMGEKRRKMRFERRSRNKIGPEK